MVALVGFQFSGGWLEQASDHLNIAYTDAFDNALYDERGVSSIAVGVAGILSSSTPAPLPSRVLSGMKVTGFADDWYNRIHITPQNIKLGNILSTQTATVTIWNAYFEPHTLNTISGLVEGMTLVGELPVFDFTALSEVEYTLSVPQDGASTVDTTLIWTFDNADTAQLPVTAERVLIWAFLPDWANGITERLEWLTDVLASQTLVEQRRAMRIAPRRSFSAEMFVEGRERQFLDLALFNWSARIWGIPIWPEVQILTGAVARNALRINCDTVYLDFHVGGLAILLGATALESEGLEIAGVDATGIDLASPLNNAWPAGTRLYPARTAQLTREPRLKRLTDQAVSADVSFLVMEPSDWAEVLPATLYRGYPVLETRPNETEDLDIDQARLLATLDSGSALPLTTDIAGAAMPLRGWQWLGEGRQARAEVRSLLHGLRGRQKAIWIPTHADDLTVMADIVGAAIDIAFCGYTRFGKLDPGRRDIRIELFDGSVFHRRIIGTEELSTTIERLQIDSVLGVTVLQLQIQRVCWMTLCRLSSDSVDIEHITDSKGIAQCSLTFRGVRDDAI